MFKRRKTFHEIATATIIIVIVAVLSITYALLNVNAGALELSAREYGISVAENVSYRIFYEVEGFEAALKQIINILNSPGIQARLLCQICFLRKYIKPPLKKEDITGLLLMKKMVPDWVSLFPGGAEMKSLLFFILR
jgi:hypothetical protein